MAFLCVGVAGEGEEDIVRLTPVKDARHDADALFAHMGTAWDALASRWDDEQVAVLLEFLHRYNDLSRQEIVRLREAPSSAGGVFSTPLGEVRRGRLVVVSGSARVSVRAGNALAALYQARFEGPQPEVKAKDGVVSVRYLRRLLGLAGVHGVAEVALNAAIPWRIAIQGKAAAIAAELDGLDLAGLEVKGGFSQVHLDLPEPSGVVPIRINGAASDVTIRRPPGVAARIHLKGWVSALAFDDQAYGAVGNDVRLHSSGFDAAAPYYDIEATGAASMVTIISG